MKEKIPMSRYDLRHTLASVIASAAILSFTGCGGGSEAEISVNKTPVVTENNATPVVSPSNTGNETETKVAVKIPAEIPKSGPMVADASGNLYIADRTKCSIVKVTPSGEASLFAGRSRKCPDASIQPKDGMGEQAEFGYLHAITIDVSGNIYVADNDNISYDYRGNRINKGSSIRKITPEGVVTQFAGSFVESGYIDSNGKNARFSNEIFSLTADDDGNIYAADISNGVVRKLQPNGDVTTHFNLSPFKFYPYFIQYDGMDKFYILSSNGLGDVFLYKNNDGVTRLSIWPPYRFSSNLQVDKSNGDIYFLMPDRDINENYVAGSQVEVHYKIYRSNSVSTQVYSSDYLNKIYEVGYFVDGDISMTVVSPGVLAVLDNGKISRITKK